MSSSKGDMMWPITKGVPITGRLGEMLARPLKLVSVDGAVHGLCVLPLGIAEAKGAACQWCANDSEQVVCLEIVKRTAFAQYTRMLTMTLCVSACSSCYTDLMESFQG